MKKFTTTLILAMILLTTTIASALTIELGDMVYLQSNPYKLVHDGNEYDIFCLERRVPISLETYYHVDSIGNVATHGGYNWGTSEDIFSHYRQQDLAGDPVSDYTKMIFAAYNDGVFGQTSYGNVQNAIHFSEDERSDSYWYHFYMQQIGYNYNFSDWEINAINLVELTDVGRGFSHRQSQLFGYKNSPVPEPATFLLLGVGLLGIAGTARKRRQI